jgi:hypothetical protein
MRSYPPLNKRSSEGRRVAGTRPGYGSGSRTVRARVPIETYLPSTQFYYTTIPLEQPILDSFFIPPSGAFSLLPVRKSEQLTKCHSVDHMQQMTMLYVEIAARRSSDLFI